MQRFYYLTICLILVFIQNLRGQPITPPVSSWTLIEQTIGFSHLQLTYSRPNVNGRNIFGDLIPFNQIWRAGANESTKISLSTSSIFDGKTIPAGTYAIYIKPEEENWMFILNSDTTLWGVRGYNPHLDVCKLSISPKRNITPVESLFWGFENVLYDRADLVLKWSTYELRVPVHVPTDEIAEYRIAQKLSANPTANDYYAAARYYLETGKDLNQALKWMEQRVALGGPQFGILRYKALIEKKLGKHGVANNTMRQSLDLAREKGNDHYVRMNEKSLQQWSKEKVVLSGLEIIKRSIAYHDPRDIWNSDTISIRLYESRPNGGYRISDLSINIQKEYFEMNQRKDRDLIMRKFDKESGCQHKLNGKTEFSDEQKQKHRLDCERSAFYKNYYTYLWFLPMKLNDDGTIIDDQVYKVIFDEKELLQVRVTYDSTVGGDIWYFYFDPSTFALKGYRFYHDEEINDGEYILLEGESKVGSMLIPTKRSWYTHQGSRYLGSDEIIE